MVCVNANIYDINKLSRDLYIDGRMSYGDGKNRKVLKLLQLLRE